MQRKTCYSCKTEITSPEFECELEGNGCGDHFTLCQECWETTCKAIRTLDYHPNFLSEDLKFNAHVNYAQHYFENIFKYK